MKKEFSLQSFKSSASKASDFLKTKGHDIPRSLMLNTLSVFMGTKNWNTAQAMLSREKENKEVNNLDDIIKSKNGLVLIASRDPQKVINYIHNVISINLRKDTRDSKILRAQSLKKYYKDLDNNICVGVNELGAFSMITAAGLELNYNKSWKLVLDIFMRRSPDYIIFDLLVEDEIIIPIIEASSTGNLVFLGVELKSTKSAKDELFNRLVKSENITLNDALYINEVVKDVIYLD